MKKRKRGTFEETHEFVAERLIIPVILIVDRLVIRVVVIILVGIIVVAVFYWFVVFFVRGRRRRRDTNKGALAFSGGHVIQHR